MSFVADLQSFLYSDASGRPVEELISPQRLWLNNVLLHGLITWALVVHGFYYPRALSAQRLLGGFGAYCALQLVQLINDPKASVAIDGLWDIVCVALAAAWALALTARDVPPWNGASR